MIRIKVFLAIAGMVLLVACAGEPVRDHYYSLVLAADDVPAQTAINTDGAILTVGPIMMSRYLNQPGVATQRGAQQIEIANHRFWAEPLEEGIGKVLVRDISSRNSSLVVARQLGGRLDRSDCRLRLEFDKFQITDTAFVVARGRYWLTSQALVQGTQKEFDLAQQLGADGYANAVSQLRGLLGELSEQIVAAIENDRVCERKLPNHGA